MGHCPVCSESLVPHSIRGTSMEKCSGCGGLWLHREGVLTLRDTGAVEDPSLASTRSTERKDRSNLRCPSCHKTMDTFEYRGGSVTVDRCSSCDHFFLDPGELRTILREWEEGFELGARGQAALVGFRYQRLSQLSTPFWMLIVGSLLFFGVRLLDVFLGLAFEFGFVIAIAILGTIITGVAMFLRQEHAKREEEKIVQESKINQILKDSKVGAQSVKPTSAEPTTIRCPWCRAKIPAGSSHCDECDSDIPT